LQHRCIYGKFARKSILKRTAMKSRSVLVLAFASVMLSLIGPAPTRAADLSVRYSERGNGGALGTWHYLGFWGSSFPWGYRWSVAAACRQRELVETPRGPRWRTAWVCHFPARYARW
jgi:hypothetical protein